MEGPGRGGNGRFVRTLTVAERDAEAARLRERGHSYHEIAEALGYKGGKKAESARRAVERALAAIPAEPAEEVRRRQLAQLDYMTLKALQVLEGRHVTVSHGKVVMVPKRDEAGNYFLDEDGRQVMVPLEDDAPVLQAIGQLLRIQERRARLLGLDAPVGLRHEVITENAIDAEIRRLAAELGTTGAVGQAPGAEEVTR